jgi:Holliday junction resolvase
MTYARRTDSSHAEVRDTLRKLGYAVVDTSRAGSGFPDLVVCDREGRTVLVEVKARTGRLRASQERFRENWPGRYVVLRSAEEAVQWWREEAA